MVTLDLNSHLSISIAYNLFIVYFLLCTSSPSNPLSQFSFAFEKKEMFLEKE